MLQQFDWKIILYTSLTTTIRCVLYCILYIEIETTWRGNHKYHNLKMLPIQAHSVLRENVLIIINQSTEIISTGMFENLLYFSLP